MINESDNNSRYLDVMDIVIYQDQALIKRSQISNLKEGENSIIFKDLGNSIIKDSIKTYIPEKIENTQIISTEFQLKSIENFIEIIVHCGKAIKTSIVLSYLIQEVDWRVSYEARLNLQKSNIELDYYAEIRQNTGENWNKARISLSRSQIQRGTIFQIPGESSLSSDNKWYKIKILKKNLSCQLSYETNPSVIEYVYLKARIRNNTKYPLFEGPIQIYKNKKYIGKSRIKYTSPEDTLELSFGIDEDLRVKRTKITDRILPAKGLNLKNIREYKYEFILYNFKSNAQNVCLKEAIHRSRAKEVDIQILKESTKEYQLQKNGIIKWNIQLPSSSYDFKKLCLHYKITAPKNYDLTEI